MADSSWLFSLSNLVCREDEASFDVEEPNDEKENGEHLLLEADDEYIELLLNRERCFCIRTRDASLDDSSLKSARSDAVRWILRRNAFFGFGMKTEYLAVSYFDHFFLHRTVEVMEGKSWAIQLLSVACLSVAMKMEECKNPSLSELQREGYRFHAEAIQRMELLILSTLEWRMSMVTPFSYLSYFASKFQEHGLQGLVWKASKLISASIEVMNVVDYRPSVIAAAAILAVLYERLTQKSVESKMSTISSCRSLDTGHVFSCYSLMSQATQKQNLKTSMHLAASNQSAVNCSSINSSVDANGTVSLVVASSNSRRLQ